MANESDKVEESFLQRKPGVIDSFGIERLERIQERIREAVGLDFIAVDYTGNPITKQDVSGEFTKRLRENSAYADVLRRSDAFGALQAAISNKPYIYFDSLGLPETAIPLMAEGEFLGGLIGGQVFCSDAPLDIIRLDKLFGQSEGIFQEKRIEELKNTEIKSYSYSHYLDLMNLLNLIIEDFLGEQKNLEKESLRYTVSESGGNLELKNRINYLELKIDNILLSLNEYFLVNLLSSISSRAILEGAEETNELLIELSEYLRNCRVAEGKNWTLEEEFAEINRYVRLSCAKYEGRFKYQFHISEKLKTRLIPAYTLLPFVQHAVYYGIGLKKGEASLTVSASFDNNDILVDISENGPGYGTYELSELFQGFNGKHEGEYIDRAVHWASSRICMEFGDSYAPEVSVGLGVGRRFRVRFPGVFPGGMVSEVSTDR